MTSTLFDPTAFDPVQRGAEEVRCPGLRAPNIVPVPDPSASCRRLLKKYSGSRYKRHGARSKTALRGHSHALHRGAPAPEMAPCRLNP